MFLEHLASDNGAICINITCYTLTDYEHVLPKNLYM